MITGNTRNNFWRRFREKIKVSKKAYGKKDRKANKQCHIKEKNDY